MHSRGNLQPPNRESPPGQSELTLEAPAWPTASSGPKQPLPLEALRAMEPVAADRCLPALIGALGAAEAHVAAEAERLVARHPLLGLRSGPWTLRNAASPITREFFPQPQIAATARALQVLTETAAGSVRLRMVGSLARLAGLGNVVDWRTLALEAEERDRYEAWVTAQTLSQFKPQLTIVLSYQCNQRCPYCFSDALAHRLTQTISYERFLQALHWGRRAGVSRVPVTGGEPTLHPEFARFMAELRARRLTTCFSTNGCVPRAAFECLAPDFVEAVTFHVLDDDEYQPGQAAQVEANIRVVKDQGIPFILRYVLAGKPTPARYLEWAARYRPWMLTFSPVFPGPYRREMSRDVRGMFQAKEALLTLARGATRLHIRPVVAKPVPWCMFTRAEFLELAAIATLENVCDVFQNDYTNNTLVNPDLSLYPCMALPLTGARLDTTPSLQHFSAVSRQAVEPLQGIPMLDECAGCQLFHLRLCQPACLGFCLPPHSP